MTKMIATAPPHSLDAEQAVLGGLLLDNGAIDRMGELKPEAFYAHENRLVYEHILRLLSLQKPADVVTVSDSLAQAGKNIGLAYLHDLAANTPSAANIGRYAETVRDKALMRGLAAAANRVHEIVGGSGETASHMLDAAQAEFAKLSEQAARKEPVALREAMSRYLDDLDNRYHGKIKHNGIPTGLSGLDAMLNGGLRRGALITFGARPGMGKSAWAETVACNIADTGHSVLFLSMEMPEAEVTERAIAMWGSVSASRLADASKSMRTEDWPLVTAAAQKAAEAKFFIDDQPGLSLMDVVAKARAVKRKEGLDVLVIDYLQLMVGTEEKRYLQIEAITKGLKMLAKTLNIAVIALSQFSRDIEKRPNPRPKSSDFRDGGSIEQDSDILLGLYREEQDNPDSTWKGYAELFIMKNRQGKTGKLSLTYKGEFMRFENHSGPVPDNSPKPKPRRGFDG